MFYSNLTYLTVIFFLCYKVIVKEFNLFHCFVFVLPFHSWVYDIGLSLTIGQILSILMIFSAIKLSSKEKKNLIYLGNFYSGFFFLYSIFNTIIISLLFIDEFREIGGYFRSEGRYLSQLVLLMMSFSILPLAYNYIKEVKDIQRYLKVYLLALGFLTLLGWVQFIVYSISGLDIFPLSINQFGEIRTGLYDVEQLRLFRISSLGGEPKGFSMSLVIGFFIVHVFNTYGIVFFKHDIAYKYLLLLTSFATLSTSGIVLFVILFIFNILYAIRRGVLKKVKMNKVFIHFLILLPVCFVTYSYWNIFSLIIEERVFGRDIISEDYDAPIQIFLIEFPQYLLFGSGLGNIHNLAYPFIPNVSLSYMADSIFVAKSGYLRLISELGLVGFLLFVLMIFNVFRKLGLISKHLCFRTHSYFNAMRILLLTITIGYFARSYLIYDLFLFLSMANVMVYSKTIRQKIIR